MPRHSAPVQVSPTRVAPSKPRAFDWLVVGLLFSYVWRIQDLYPILAKVQLPILVSLAALALFFMEGHAKRLRKMGREPILRAATFLLVWMVLSVPGSVFPGLSFRFIFNDHIKTFLMMLMIMVSVRGLADVERLVLAQVAGAGIYCLKILTEFHIGSNGRLNELLYYDSNGLALLIVASLPLAVSFLPSGSKIWRRMLALAASAIFVVAIVRTGSRGGFLALIAVTAYLVFAFRAIKAHVRIGAVAACAVLLFTVAGPRYWTMMATLLHPTQDYNWEGNNDVGRMDIWKRGIGYMNEHPLFGVGANAFPVAEGTISPLARRQERGIGLKWSAAHNSFVQVGAELGYPGLIAFVTLLALAFRTMWRVGRASSSTDPVRRRQGVLGQALVGSLIGYVVAGFFLSQAYSAFLYGTLGIIVGLARTAGPNGGRRTNPVPRQRHVRSTPAPHTRAVRVKHS